MFATSTRELCCAVVLVGIVLTVNAAARAAKVAEFNYHTSEDASFAQGPLTGDFNLFGAATTPPGAVQNSGVAVGTGVQSPARTGYLDLTDSNDGAQSTESYTKYFGPGPAAVGQSPNTFNYATKTFVAVMKPGYSGVQMAARRWFLNTAGSGGPTSEAFYVTDGTGAALVNGGRPTENDFTVATSSGVSWNSNAWYMIGYSLQPSSAEDTGNSTVFGNLGLADGKIRLYIRELKVSGVMTPGSTPITASSDVVRIWNDRQVVSGSNPFPPNMNAQLLAFGNRNDGNTIGNEGANHDFALIQLYNNFSDFSDFDAIFASIIPEPSSAAMVMIAGCLVASRRRRRWK